jgi:hypothetical protein
MRDDSLVTAGLVLVGSLALNAVGLLLLSVGGVAIVFAIMLLTFGVTGCGQALMIAFGRRPASGQTHKASVEDDGDPAAVKRRGSRVRSR